MIAQSDFPLKLVKDSKCQLGEGPLWDTRRNCLYWVDILNHALHMHDPADPHRDRVLQAEPYISSVVPRHSGGLAVTLKDGYYALDPDSGKLTQLAAVATSSDRIRFNDGKCDPRGRYFAGTMSMSNESRQGSLYRLDPSLSIESILQGVSISNGLAWSSDGNTLYYIDTPERSVFAFDYDLSSGLPSNRRVAIRIPNEQGYPDGMTIDTEGMLWIAHWGGGQVTRWNPETGTQLLRVQLPVSQVTSCTFGGPKLSTLYITTARTGLSEKELQKQPLAGGLFALETRHAGTPAMAFLG